MFQLKKQNRLHWISFHLSFFCLSDELLLFFFFWNSCERPDKMSQYLFLFEGKKKKLNLETNSSRGVTKSINFFEIMKRSISLLEEWRCRAAAAPRDVRPPHGIWRERKSSCRKTGSEPLAGQRLIGLYLRALLLQLLWVDEYISMWHAQSWRQASLSPQLAEWGVCVCVCV